VNGGPKRCDGSSDPKRLRSNFEQHCLPGRLLDADVAPYGDFLPERRRLMALRIRAWFETLVDVAACPSLPTAAPLRPPMQSCRDR
jgi:hypothetical protein